MSKHTPGRRAAEALESAGYLVGGVNLAYVARLIDQQTAAPELAEAVKFIVDATSEIAPGVYGMSAESLAEARAALRKAGAL